MRRRSHPIVIVLALAAVVAACGGDDATTTSAAPAAEAGMDHSHDEGVEIGGGVAVPTVEIDVLPDPVKGWNVFADVADFTFDPEAASTEHVDGRGHAHLYVDGVKIARVYGTAFHIGSLEPGSHEIRYTLNANDHRQYLHGGEPIAAVASIEVPETAEDDHAHEMGEGGAAVPEGAAIPTVTIEVTEDPKMGWNVHFPTTDFAFAPRSAGMAAVWGEGHAHLYVDGQKVARPYGEWYHLGPLDPGTHEIRVTLNHNDHADYVVEERVIEAVATVTVEGSAAAPDRIIEVDAAVDGFRAGRHEVGLGETVALRVLMADAGTVHVHGYDVYAEAAGGSVTEVVFTADIPGVFEIEDEVTGTLLAELVVG
jgi:hypothetical protein